MQPRPKGEGRGNFAGVVGAREEPTRQIHQVQARGAEGGNAVLDRAGLQDAHEHAVGAGGGGICLCLARVAPADACSQQLQRRVTCMPQAAQLAMHGRSSFR